MGLWDEISSLFRDKNVQNVGIFCHRNADPDALGSSQGLKNLILELFPSVARVEIVAEDINEISARMIEVYPSITFRNEITREQDVSILVDVNNLQHIGKFGDRIKTSEKPIIVIDHHVPQAVGNENVAIKYIDEEASSTAEMISFLYESIGRTPSKVEATVLLIGIIYDSKRFSIVGTNTFHAAAFLIGSGADYEIVLSVLRKPIGRSEKIARLKASQRSKIDEVKGWIIASSVVSSFGASACRGLIDLGADVALVSSDKKRQRRISIRSTSIFYKETGVNLAKLMGKVGEELNGHGGGHATAATVSGIDNVDRGKTLILRYIEEEILGSKGQPRAPTE